MRKRFYRFVAQPSASVTDNWDKVGAFILFAGIGLVLLVVGLISGSLPTVLVGLGIGILSALLFLH